MFRSSLTEREFLNVINLVFDILKDAKDDTSLADIGPQIRRSNVPLFTAKISDMDILLALSLLTDRGCVSSYVVEKGMDLTVYYRKGSIQYFPFEDGLEEASECA